MPIAPQTFACPACGKRFTWKPHFAGRKMSCTCGRVFEATLGREGQPMSGDVYAVNHESASDVRATTQKYKTLYPEHRAKPHLSEEVEKPHPLRDGIIPTILLITGVVGRLTQILFAPHHASILITFGFAFFELALNQSVVLLSAFTAMKFLDTQFGKISATIFKLLAIATFNWAVAGWLAIIFPHKLEYNAFVLSIYSVVGLYFAEFTTMFGLEGFEAGFIVLMICVLQGAALMGMYLTVH